MKVSQLLKFLSIALVLSTQASSAIATAPPEWQPTTITGAPNAREQQTTVWTDTKMLVWGGFLKSGPPTNTGGQFDPANDSWSSITNTNAPTARWGHTAIWTGSEMIVWGGSSSEYANQGYLNTGARYNPATDSWAATSTTNAPTARYWHVAVWTGRKMIVWGGDTQAGDTNTGGIYDPKADSWESLSTTNAPSARDSATAVSTGTRMLVWGGSGSGLQNSGGVYDYSANSWSSMTTNSAPTARYKHTAVFANTKMIVWGGWTSTGVTNTGGIDDSSSDSWTQTESTDAPVARDDHAAVVDGSDMIIWGGLAASRNTNTGAVYEYDSTKNSWSWASISTQSAPSARALPSMVWTGTKLVVWGGNNLNTGGIYQQYIPPTPEVSGFTNDFAPATWSQGSNAPINLVDTSAAPTSITLRSYMPWAVSGVGIGHTAPYNAKVNFSWEYYSPTPESRSGCPATYTVNGTVIHLTSRVSPTGLQRGTQSFQIESGEKFSFFLNGESLPTDFGCKNTGPNKIRLTISDFEVFRTD